MLGLYLCKIAPLTEDTFYRFLPYLPQEKQARLLRLPKDKANASMIGELLLRYGVKACFGIAPNTLKTAVKANGKPYVTSHPEVEFNISHSGDYVACGISDRPIGVDIQKAQSGNVTRLAQRAFGKKEWAEFVENGEGEETFFTLWARKEALGKLTGEGLRSLKEDWTVPHKIVVETVLDRHFLCVVEGVTP